MEFIDPKPGLVRRGEDEGEKHSRGTEDQDRQRDHDATHRGPTTVPQGGEPEQAFANHL